LKFASDSNNHSLGGQSARRAVAPVDRCSNGVLVGASSGQEKSLTNNKKIYCLPND
jgi:hypothetical protein